MVVLLFNGSKVKIHHDGKLTITCFVQNRGCSSAQGRKFLVKEHLHGITEFTNNVIVFLFIYWKSDRGIEKDLSHTPRTCLTRRLPASSHESVL